MTDDERTRLADALATLKAALDDLPGISDAVDLALLDLERLRDGLTVTGHVPEVARLDRSKPSPGYHVDEQDDGWWWWVAEPEDGNMEPCDSEADAVAAAWIHHQEHNDPPGMWTSDDDWGVLAWPYRLGTGGRVAAWAWYWRRVAVSLAVDALLECMLCDNRDPVVEHFDDGTCSQPWCVECDSEMGGFPDPWPECLAWSDEQVAEVERWLVEGGEVPEVLRAG